MQQLECSMTQREQEENKKITLAGTSVPPCAHFEHSTLRRGPHVARNGAYLSPLTDVRSPAKKHKVSNTQINLFSTSFSPLLSTTSLPQL
jgi:hypothetical protein